MTDTEIEIRRLARELQAAHTRAAGLRYMNTAGMTADEAMMVAEEVAVADAECMRLNAALARAQGRYAEGK